MDTTALIVADLSRVFALSNGELHLIALSRLPGSGDLITTRCNKEFAARYEEGADLRNLVVCGLCFVRYRREHGIGPQTFGLEPSPVPAARSSEQSEWFFSRTAS